VEDGGELSPVEEFLQATRAELEQVRREAKEITLLVEQSQGEVEKLAQRNASIASNLRQLQAHFDTVPREDIRSAYESAQDGQQRLFTMRGQLEKLQSDQLHLKRFSDFLSRALQLMEGSPTIDVSPEVAKTYSGVDKIIDAQEEERRRMSRQLHDGPAQALSNFILVAEIALRLFDVNPEKAREELNNLKSAANASFAEVRDFIFELRPMMLDDLGLVPTARRYTEAYKDKSGLTVTMVVTGSERRLESHREVMIFRGIQELLGNVREHAQATQVKISLDMDTAQIRVGVEDNGKGFSAEVLEDESASGRGLRTLRDRLGLVGGTLDVDSSPGKGTRVMFTVPTGE
jgi:two-component system sensor histidine kinase DegS